MRPLYNTFVVFGFAFLAQASLDHAACHAFTREAKAFESENIWGSLAPDCMLQSYDVCSGWIWTFSDVAGAEWGVILDPRDCAASCPTGGAISDIWIYGRATAAVGQISGVAAYTVDERGCRTELLWRSGPITTTHCVADDGWTQVSTPPTAVHSRPFLVTVAFAGVPGTSSNIQLASDNAVANLMCHRGVSETFPGCASDADGGCGTWSLAPERTYIYFTDINHDGTIDDLCALYGAPYLLAFPYVYPYGYLPNNLLISVGPDCSRPSAVETTSWGRVKALLQ